MPEKIAGLNAVARKEDVLGVAQKVRVVCFWDLHVLTSMDVTVLLVDKQGMNVFRKPMVS